jgi:hypothetical protein
MAASLCELLDRGVVVQAHEAVAIVQQLINKGTSADGDELPPGPSSVTSIHLQSDGSLFTAGSDVAPSVFEAATLLKVMLPAGAGQVPGALRYTIARGLLEVVAPPFESIGEFSRALERFERGDRRAVVAGLLNRVLQQVPVAPPVVPQAPPVLEVAREAPAVREREVTPVRDLVHESPAVVDLVPAPRLVAFDDALDLDLRPADGAEIRIFRPREEHTFGRLWAVAAVLLGAVAFGGVANVTRIGAFRPHLPARATAAPQTVPDTAPRTVPDNVPLTVPSTVPSPLPGTVSGTAGTVSDAAVSVPDSIPGAVRDTIPGADGDADAGIVSAVDAQQRPIFSPSFASNGAAMFFHTGSTNDDRSALAVVQAPVDGGDLRVMTIVADGARNYHVQPSPDGRLVAFDSDRDGERGVYVANRDGSDVRRISAPGYAAVPTWSPDGTRLTYIRAEPDQPKVWNLWLQAREGGEPVRLTHYRYGQPWGASWFPDNRRICYTHEDKIVLMDLETRRMWTFASPMSDRLVRTPAVSPDGTRVIFQVAKDGAWILDLSDRSMRRVLTDPTAEEFAWAPDGRRIAFHSRRDGQWGIYILH